MKTSRRRLADYVKTLHKKGAARVARSFFLIQPIKSLVCGVVVAAEFHLSTATVWKESGPFINVK